MFRSGLILFMSLLAGLAHASYNFTSYPSDALELDGKITNYYEVISEDFGKVVLASRGSHMDLSDSFLDQYSMTISRFSYRSTEMLTNIWRPLPHQIILNGQDHATFKIKNQITNVDFDKILGEIVFHDGAVSDALADAYLAHFSSIYTREARGTDSRNMLWLSNMNCRNISFSKDNDGKLIRKGLRCTFDFIFDGSKSTSQLHSSTKYSK